MGKQEKAVVAAFNGAVPHHQVSALPIGGGRYGKNAYTALLKHDRDKLRSWQKAMTYRILEN
jgi:hypothetical protein